MTTPDSGPSGETDEPTAGDESAGDDEPAALDELAAGDNGSERASFEDQGHGTTPRVVRRRDSQEMTAEERAFLARHRADMPPHHDSAWG